MSMMLLDIDKSAVLDADRYDVNVPLTEEAIEALQSLINRGELPPGAGLGDAIGAVIELYARVAQMLGDSITAPSAETANLDSMADDSRMSDDI